MNCYKKVFICEITQNWKGKMAVTFIALNFKIALFTLYCYLFSIIVGENLKSEAVKVVMKSSILGVITGIQKFSRRTIYTGNLNYLFAILY